MANKSTNPALRSFTTPAASAATLQDMYNQPSFTPPTSPAAQRYLTVDDVVAKTATVVIVALLSALATIYLQKSAIVPGIYSLVIPAAIVGFVLALIVIFKRSSNPALILAYAVAEGVFLGGITGIFEGIRGFEGIGFQALAATMGVFIGMLVVYKTGAIRVTPKFTKMIIGAMIGIVSLLIVNLVARLLGFDMGVRDGGTLSIIISLVIIVVAALSFLLDFDAIEGAIKQGAPATMAWYFAFSLMVTLVWLYLEILRLLSYLRSN
ncbi:Bax inhibitor-1/YccA family protein [Nakamurella antarctica]|uniref:Bax inhibitor-1/YccA family protein n=1 Tax=Nakamurella antarctica TaxID=1902245 RepID=UPI001EF036B6|nr:Bax inhibitor-1/YccA family protein [Nakamurella antarctica]